MKRNVYLQTKDLQAIHLILDELLFGLEVESIPTVNSIHRISSKAVYAKVSSPVYNASAMDGIVTKASLTYGASETTPITITKEHYEYINTGNEIPIEYDAVVMIEDVFMNEDKSITLYKSVRPYQDIRPIGEDIAVGDVVIPRNHKIRPIDISLLLSSGIDTISVYKKPRIAIIPTGDEIVKTVGELKKGTIMDSNTPFLQNELELLGTNVTVFPIQEDNYDTLKQTILRASVTFDIVLVGAGSSAGSKDFVKQIIEESGTVFVHGISIKPGKPTIIGAMNNTPIFGIPGYPVSTYIAYEEIIKPYIQKLFHQQLNEKTIIQATVTQKIYSSLKHQEFIRVKLGWMNNHFVATPLPRGAGITKSIVQADGIVSIPKQSEGHQVGDVVDVALLKPTDTIKKSLKVIGSHDIILDVIHDLMIQKNYHISSSHVGSFSGVLAMKAGGCHIAPIHILNQDGTYNSHIITQYLNDSVVLVSGVSRTQGLYVKKGNPKNIQSLQDLTRSDITFVNRQKSSGTRILLDHLLKKQDINPTDIDGYNYELTTHTLVASSVKDDRFDTGMGIHSVSNLHDLDFVPLAEERYDFLVRRDILDTMLFNVFLTTIRSTTFTQQLNTLGGYTITNIGDII